MLQLPSITSPSQHEVSVHHNQPKTCSLHGWWSAPCVAVGLRLGPCAKHTSVIDVVLKWTTWHCTASVAERARVSTPDMQQWTIFSKDHWPQQRFPLSSIPQVLLTLMERGQIKFCDALEEWPHIGMQCYLPRYIRSISHGPCSKRSRVGAYSQAEKAKIQN